MSGDVSLPPYCITKLQSCLVFLYFLSQVILASGYYAAFKVTLIAKALEGVYDGAVHITTDYEVCVSWTT